VLLDYGARIDATDEEGKTPLMLAVTARRSTREGYELPASAAVKFLLDRGAKVHIRNDAGKTALALALEQMKNLDSYHRGEDQEERKEDQEERADIEHTLALLRQHGARP
ncbi:MAG TPA: hypothetical protein VKU00_19425, partial [Chthonomonadaceae bacterium]|nr:hypothetical protein [Chthonomonadaceae bacterium]